MKLAFAKLLFLLSLTMEFAGGRIHAQEVIINPQYEEAGNFHGGVAPVLVDKRWGLIDRRGSWVLRPRYQKMIRGGDGLFGVSEGGSWGFVDSSGRIAIAQKFEAVEPFENGTAAVKINGRWVYVRPNGMTETQAVFLEIGGGEGEFVSAGGAEGWAIFKILSGRPPVRYRYENYLMIQRAY